MNWILRPLPPSAQMALKTFLGVLLALGLSSCDRDSPTEAKRTVPAPDSVWVADIVGFAIALQDVQSRILPALGTGAALDALGGALADLERALLPPDAAALEDALRRANAAARQVPADMTHLPDRDVMLLVLENIDAVAHAAAEENRRGP